MAEGGDGFPHTHLRGGFRAFCVIHKLHARTIDVSHLTNPRITHKLFISHDNAFPCYSCNHLSCDKGISHAIITPPVY